MPKKDEIYFSSIGGELIPSLMVFLFSCLGLIRPVHAQSRSLDYYLNHAIQNSPAITAAHNSADSARLQKKIINADLNRPYVSASGDYNYAPYSDHWGYDPAITDGGHYDALLNVDYPLFTGKQKKVRRRSSEISIRRSSYQIKQVKHQLRQSITDQYITSYQDLMQLRYLGDILDLLKRQKKIMNRLARQGITQITDFKQFNIQLQSNRIKKKKAKSTYQKDLFTLKAMSGIADTLTSIKLEKPAIAIDMRKPKRSRFMKKYRMDSLRIANQQGRFELKYQPSVSLFGNTGLNAVQFTGIQNRFGFSGGLHVSVPIFDGNQRSITRQQSRLQQQSVDAFQQRFRQKRMLRLSSLRRQLQQTKQQLELIRQQISQYKDLLGNYRKELANGISSVVNYLIVLRNYTNARQQQVQATGQFLRLKNQYNYWNW